MVSKACATASVTVAETSMRPAVLSNAILRSNASKVWRWTSRGALRTSSARSGMREALRELVGFGVLLLDGDLGESCAYHQPSIVQPPTQ